MKKKYITPTTEATAYQTESLMAGSDPNITQSADAKVGDITTNTNSTASGSGKSKSFNAWETWDE
jgi:hypothetical protein